MSSAKSMLSGKTDIEVTPDDQAKINEFARLYSRLDEVKAGVQKKRKNLLDTNEAIDEIMLQDDQLPVQLLIGETFISYDYDGGHLEMEKVKDDLTVEVDALLKEEEELRETISKLKSDLYAKFGSSINLEAEEESSS